MKCWLLSALLGFVVPALARTGIVQTQDGTTYLGSIRLEQDRLIVANLERAEIVPVDASVLRRASFEREPIALSEAVVDLPWGRLPAPWRQAGIGGAEGNTEWRGGLYRIEVSGNAESERRVETFVFQSASDETEIIARILEVPREGGPSSAAGVSIRGGLQPQARLIFLGVSAAGNGVLQWRDQPGAPLRSVPLPAMAPPYWLRLKGDSEGINAYRSSTGQRWQLIDRIQVAFGAEGFVGLSVLAGERQLAARPGAGSRRVGAGSALLDNVRAGRSLKLTSFVPRARLRSGSVVAGRMQAATGQQIHFPGPLPSPTLRVEDIASLEFQWLSPRVAEGVQAGRAGLFLSNGEFVEGSFRGIQGSRIRLSSVLFGLKSYDLNSEVIALVMGPSREIATSYEVVTSDGSRWRAAALEIGEHEIIIREPMLGRVRISAHNLLEIRRTE